MLGVVEGEKSRIEVEVVDRMQFAVGGGPWNAEACDADEGFVAGMAGADWGAGKVMCVLTQGVAVEGLDCTLSLGSGKVALRLEKVAIHFRIQVQFGIRMAEEGLGEVVGVASVGEAIACMGYAASVRELQQDLEPREPLTLDTCPSVGRYDAALDLSSASEALQRPRVAASNS